LSIDIEGSDLAALKAIDYERYPIPVICAETSVFDFDKNQLGGKILEIQEFLLANGYFIYADTYINTIFVNKNWFYDA
jgi:hypothetical protein